MYLLFDLDGTLTDPFEGITRSIVHALSCLDCPTPDPQSLGWCIGPSLRTSLATLLGTTDRQVVENALVRYRERFSSKGLFENKVYAGIPQTLQTLTDQGHTLYVATAKPAIYAEKIIRHFDLQNFFQKIYGSELDGTRSDKTDLIAHILDQEALFPAEVIMIGDHAQDMIGARRNNVHSIGVLWGYGTKDELEKAGADLTIGSPHAFPASVNHILS